MLTDLNTLAQSLAQSWLAFSVVLAVQIGLVLLLRKPVRARLGAVACYRLWLLPLLCLPFYLAGPSLLQKLASLDASVAQHDTQVLPDLQQFINFELLPFDFDAGTGELAAGGGTAVNGWLVLILVWGTGTVALIAWHGRRWLDFSRQVDALASPLPAAERKHSGAVAHFSTQVPVLKLRGMGGAALFGVFKPVLLLSESFCQHYDGNQRHIILAHEAVHLRRGDNAWNLGAMLLMALFWTNPLVLLAWRYYRLDQELSCDALALTRCNSEQQQRYARTLLDSLHSLSSHTAQPGLTAWDDLGDIKERSLMIKQHLRTARRPVAMLFSLASLAVLGASVTVTFAELVSPAAQAAEPTPAARQVEREARQVKQEAQRVERASQQVAQEAQQVERASRQVNQQAQQVEQVSRQVDQQAQRVEQRARQLAQGSQQAAQDEKQLAQVSRQLAQVDQQLAQVSEQLEQQEQADTAVAIEEQTGRVFTQAIELLNEDQFAGARELLNEVRTDRFNPFELSRFHQLMFSIEMNDENYPAAREQLQLAIASGGLNAQEVSQMRYQMAQLYVQEEKYAEAAAALEAWIAAEERPNSAAYYLLAASYYYQSLFDKALPNAQMAIDLAGDKPMEGWLSMLASLLIQKQDYAAVTPVVQRMVTLFPDKKAYWAQLSGIYLQQEQYVAAEGVLAEMVERFPDDESYRKQLEDLKAVNAR